MSNRHLLICHSVSIIDVEAVHIDNCVNQNEITLVVVAPPRPAAIVDPLSRPTLDPIGQFLLPIMDLIPTNRVLCQASWLRPNPSPADATGHSLSTTKYD